MLYVISGCSCGGKTTLIKALSSAGFSISDEPGRKVVREELEKDGGVLPSSNPIAFAQKCVTLSLQQHNDALRSGKVVFFDRCLVDAVSALVFEKPECADQYLRSLEEFRYADTVFMAPPWPEHYENDAERKHTLEDAIAEYDRLVVTYSAAGYSMLTLPKVSVTERLEFVLEHVAHP